MCGVCAIHHYRGAGIPNREEAIQIRDAMAARGPDAAGLWVSPDKKTILGHRRLSIIDLTRSADQPLSIEPGLTIAYNGEIYNYQALREELVQKGYRFKTQGDTEVILALYHCYGKDMLVRLRGMFAFILRDTRNGEVFAARDSFGMKPLYYSDNGSVVRFSSSVKAMMVGNVSHEKDDAAIAGFLMLGSVPEPFTILKAVKALPAGTFLHSVPGQALKIETWYKLSDVLSADTVNSDMSHSSHLSQTKLDKASCGGAKAALTETEIANSLRESVKDHMVADTDVGLFLSAGIDSTMILGLLKDSGFDNITTITARFGEFEGQDNDESHLAAQTAEFYGANHTEYTVSKAEFDADFQAFSQAMDQPTIDGLNTWFVAKAARAQGLKVCLSGLGADELFGGYPSFRDVPNWSRRLGRFGSANFRKPLAASLAKLTERMGLNWHPKGFALAGYVDTPESAWLVRRGLFMPWEIEEVLGKDRARTALKELDIQTQLKDSLTPDPETDFGRVIVLESSFYMKNQLLRDSDWAAMAHSLEVRLPFVDRVLFDTLAPRLSRHHAPGKDVLTRAPLSGFPPALINRPKTGFILPVGEWTQAHSSDLSILFKQQRLGGHWSRKWALEILRSSQALSV